MSDYTTSDLGLASTLLCSNYQLSSLEKTDDRWIFHFDHSPELDQFVEDYFAGRILVNPLSYSGALRTLKNYLYNAR